MLIYLFSSSWNKIEFRTDYKHKFVHLFEHLNKCEAQWLNAKIEDDTLPGQNLWQD